MIAAPNNKEQESSSSEDAAKTSISSLKSVGSNDPGFRKKTGGVRPWRVTEDVPRACIDVVIVGLGYLL